MNEPDYKEKTALHRAAQAGFLNITSALIEHGADLEARDEDKETPIFDAVRHGRPEALELLLEKGARSTSRTGMGRR